MGHVVFEKYLAERAYQRRQGASSRKRRVNSEDKSSGVPFHLSGGYLLSIQPKP